MQHSIVIAARYNGPPGSGNGGYTCGVVAGLFGDGLGPVEVTLRRPPPLERPLRVDRAGDVVRVLDDALVAEARPADLELDVPAAVGHAEAELASARYAGFEGHAFPTCFVCGPARGAGDVFAGPVSGKRGLLAAPWVAREPARELAWAALDCPGAFAAGFGERGELLLGRMTAHLHDLPRPGERCVVQAWPLGADGRKLHAATALFGQEGRLIGRARQVWIAPR